MSDHTHELTESLARRAEGVDVSTPPSLAGVRGRAGQIRRRRRTLTAGVTVAVLALAAPLVWQVAGHRGSQGVPPAGTVPIASTSAQPTASDAARDAGMDLRGIPTGGQVGLPWIDTEGMAWNLHAGDGTVVNQIDTPDGQLPVAFTTLADGRIVLQTESKTAVLDEHGTMVRAEPSRLGLAVDADSRNVAWASDEGTLRVLVADTERPTTLSPGQRDILRPVSLSSTSGDCVPPATTDSTGCAVLVNGTSGPYLVHASGLVDAVIGDVNGDNPLASASDLVWSTEKAAGQVAGVSADDLCGALLGFGTEGAPSTCDRFYGEFSPDGHQITVVQDDPDRSPADGLAPTTDRIGVFTLFQPTNRWMRTPQNDEQTLVSGTQWVNDTDLVTQVWQDGAWSLVRFDARGNATEVAPPVSDELTRPRYVVETQP